MSFFSKLFGSNKPLPPADNTQVKPVDATLFIDKNPPMVGIADAPAQIQEKRRYPRGHWQPTAVKEFLATDFWQKGNADALQFPSIDRKESALKMLRARYRQSLQEAILVIENDIRDFELMKITQIGVSSVIDQQLNQRSQELEGLEKQLGRQLELSVDDEGWLAPVIATYIDGFTVGSMEYTRVNDILGGITGIK